MKNNFSMKNDPLGKNTPLGYLVGEGPFIIRRSSLLALPGSSGPLLPPHSPDLVPRPAKRCESDRKRAERLVWGPQMEVFVRGKVSAGP